MSTEKKLLNPDRMRVALAAAAVRAKQTKVTVCMVRTVLQNSNGNPNRRKSDAKSS